MPKEVSIYGTSGRPKFTSYFVWTMFQYLGHMVADRRFCFCLAVFCEAAAVNMISCFASITDGDWFLYDVLTNVVNISDWLDS